MIKDVATRILFYKYGQDEGRGMKLLRLVPALYFITAMLIHFFFVRG